MKILLEVTCGVFSSPLIQTLLSLNLSVMCAVGWDISHDCVLLLDVDVASDLVTNQTTALLNEMIKSISKTRNVSIVTRRDTSRETAQIRVETWTEKEEERKE